MALIYIFVTEAPQSERCGLKPLASFPLGIHAGEQHPCQPRSPFLQVAEAEGLACDKILMYYTIDTDDHSHQAAVVHGLLQFGSVDSAVWQQFRAAPTAGDSLATAVDKVLGVSGQVQLPQRWCRVFGCLWHMLQDYSCCWIIAVGSNSLAVRGRNDVGWQHGKNVTSSAHCVMVSIIFHGNAVLFMQGCCKYGKWMAAS